MSNKITYLDFQTLHRRVQLRKEELSAASDSLAFMPLALEILFDLQEDESEDCITDTYYLSNVQGDEKGNDNGIDAIYIDESVGKPKVHLFNFKYTSDYKKIENNFPSSELHKIKSYLDNLMYKDDLLSKNSNKILLSKTRDIWDLMAKDNIEIYIHLCSNNSQGLIKSEKDDFERFIKSKYNNVFIYYESIDFFVNKISSKQHKKINAKIKAIDKNLFDKSDGDIKALIVDVDVRDLLRISLKNQELRLNPNPLDYSDLLKSEIDEDVFEDNVRVYLKQRSKINRGIKETALSEDAFRFFYYNNGITITCSSFNYPKQQRSPIIELEGFQIVNGSQTIHSLFEAYQEGQESFENMDILCRIYETKNEQLSIQIAEFTNSQNPVTSRDIRSNDYLQRKLEQDLKTLGFFYERKKGQFQEQRKEKRIDAEKAGQSLLALYQQKPAEAKDAKRKIFAEEYENIFHDQIDSEDIILATQLFNFIELRKNEEKIKVALGNSKRDFILHASYYLMYIISLIAKKNTIELRLENIEILKSYYDDAVNLVNAVVLEQIGNSKSTRYTHRGFFKSNDPKELLIKKI